MLKEAGADEVVIDDGRIAAMVASSRVEVFDKVLELIGTRILKDSLNCVKRGDTVCMTGIVGGEWSFKDFNPMEVIPTGVNLTVYSGGPGQFLAMHLQEMVEKVVAEKLKVKIGKSLKLGDIVEAHKLMERDETDRKIVILT